MRWISGVGALLVLAAHTGAAQDRRPGRRVFPVPILGYTPETGLMLGAALVGVVPADSASSSRPTTALATVVYTLKHQYSVNLSADRWTAANRWHLTGEASVSQFPAEFHGVGAAATESSETYTPQSVSLAAAAQRRLSRRVYVGAGYNVRRVRMVETLAGGLLAAGAVPGSTGGSAGVVTVDAVWDTRDVLYRTQRGSFVRLAVAAAGAATLSDFAYRRYTGDVRAYRRAGCGVVLAGQVLAEAVDGTAPFDRLPQLGGQNILRGFAEPRFRDDALVAAQAEVRAPLRGPVALVVFGGAGTMAPSLRGLPHGAVRASGGAGLRFLLDRREGLQLRVDWAVSRDFSGLYIAAGDAF